MAGLFIWYLTEYAIKPRFQEKTTWKKLEQGLKKIIKDINNSDFTPDVVLGMKRSGTALAAMIAGSLKSLPITTIDFEQFKEGDLGERKIRITIEPNHQVLKDKNVLIVTCFNKTGEPLKAVMDHLNGLPKSVRTVSFYEDRHAKIQSSFYAFMEEKWNERLLESMPWMSIGQWKFPHESWRPK